MYTSGEELARQVLLTGYTILYLFHHWAFDTRFSIEGYNIRLVIIMREDRYLFLFPIGILCHERDMFISIANWSTLSSVGWKLNKEP